MNKESRCKKFSDVLRVLDKSIKKDGRVIVSSRPMPSKKALELERKEFKNRGNK